MIYVALGTYAFGLLAGAILRWTAIGCWWEPQGWLEEAKNALGLILWPLLVLIWLMTLLAVLIARRLPSR